MQPQVNKKYDVHADEAHNVNKLGRYAFAYGVVMLSVFAGLLASLVILDVPLYGTFGGLALLRCFLQIVVLAMVALAAYAFYCSRHSNGIARLRSGVQIGSLAIVFATLSVGTSGFTTLILQLLGIFATGYRGLTIPVPLL